MKITLQQSNFAQFSDALWLTAEHSDAKIQFDVDQTELIDFAKNLIDVAYDCLVKSKPDTLDEEVKLAEVIESLNILEAQE